MGDPCVFFIKFPSSQKFCHIVVKIENLKKIPQNQTLKCRQLLFLCREVIASPNVFDGCLLDVVMSLTFFKEKKITPYFQKLGLKIIHTSPAMLNIIQECMTYTFQFKISPSWNMIGRFVVKGPDVVTCTGKQAAVDVDITVSHEQMTLTIRPLSIRNPPPSLEDFSICFQALQNFYHCDQDGIEEFSIYQSWCHIMPSMKRGQLVKVSRTIPIQNQDEQCSMTLSDYEGLKKYWKNHHGIKLPDTEDGMVYGSVHFKLIGPQLFTYPLCCLRTKDIQVLPRCDGATIIKEFMAAVTQKMDRVCGFKLLFSSKPCYVNNNLSEVSQIVPENFLNVSTQPKSKVPPPPVRPPMANEKFNISASEKNDVILPSQKQTSNENSDFHHSSVIPSSQVSKNEKIFTPEKSILRNLPRTADGKYIPSFGNKKKDVFVKNTSKCARKIAANLPKKKPSFNKHHSMSGQVIKGHNITASATVTKSYKVPRQNFVNMDDSGYGAGDTPIASNVAVNHNKPEKRLQPKKLCFDQTPSPAFMNTNTLSMINKVKLNTKLPSSQSKKIADGNKGASKSQCCKISPLGLGKPSQVSPLKIMKNHSFDKLFAKAGDHDLKQKKHTLNGDSKQTTKDHSFDQLFAKAGDQNQYGAITTASVKTLENHRFDQLFARAGDYNQSESRNTCDSLSTSAPFKVLKNHRFHDLFSKAGDQSICEAKEGLTSNLQVPTMGSSELGERVALFKKHNDSGVGFTEDSPLKIIPNHRFDEIFKSANSNQVMPVTKQFDKEISSSPLPVGKCDFLSSDNAEANVKIPVCSGLFKKRNSPISSFFTSDFQVQSQNSLSDQPDLFSNNSRAYDGSSSFFNKFAGNSVKNSNGRVSYLQKNPPTHPFSSTPDENVVYESNNLSQTARIESTGTKPTRNSNFSEHIKKINKLMDGPRLNHAQETQIFNQPTSTASCDVQSRPKYALHDMLQRACSDFEVANGNLRQNRMITSGTASFSVKQDETFTKPTKKRLGVGSASSIGKKPRIRKDVSIEEMARIGMLAKVNAPTLMSWLRSNGVATTSRVKKDDLIAKVKFQLMLNTNQFKGIDD